MKDKIGSQKNITPKDDSRKWGVSHIKKIFGYLLLLGIVESNIGNAQMKQIDTFRKDSLKKDTTEMVVTDHGRLIKMNADSLNIDTLRNELLVEINMERAKKNLKPLALDDNLNQGAMAYAEYMNVNNRYNHDDKNGTVPSKRVKKTGYKKVYMGEIIHSGPRSIFYVMEDWMGGKGLHSNIIEGEFSEDVGIGYCDGYWVVDFGGRYPWIKREETKK